MDDSQCFREDDGRCPANWTTLNYFVLANNVNGLRRYLERSVVNVDVADDMGFTALHCAAFLGRVECVELLLAAKANVHARSNSGETPLHRALMKPSANALGGEAFLEEKKEVMRKLLYGGSDANAETMDGTTPLDLACGMANKMAISLLKHFSGDAYKTSRKSGMDAVDTVVRSIYGSLSGLPFGCAEHSYLVDKLQNILCVLRGPNKATFKKRIKTWYPASSEAHVYRLPFTALDPPPIHPILTCTEGRLSGIVESILVDLLLRVGFDAPPRVVEELIARDSFEIVQLLVNEGISMNFKVEYRDGRNPAWGCMHVIVHACSERMSRFLLSAMTHFDLNPSMRGNTITESIDRAAKGQPFPFDVIVEEGSLFSEGDLEYLRSRFVTRLPPRRHKWFRLSLYWKTGGVQSSLIGRILEAYGEDALVVCKKLVGCGVVVPADDDSAFLDAIAGFNHYWEYARTAGKEICDLLDWLEETGRLSDINRLHACFRLPYSIVPLDDRSVDVPILLLMAVCIDANFLFEALRRGGDVTLIVRHWSDHIFWEEYPVPTSGSGTLAICLLQVFSIMALFSTPTVFNAGVAGAITWKMTGKSHERVMKVHPESYKKWKELVKSFSTPKTLKSLARFAVRQTVGGRQGLCLAHGISLLPVPTSVKDFLKFKGENPYSK